MRKGLLLKLKKLVSARNVGTSFLLGAFVLLVATYGVWQIQQLLSPDTRNSGDVGNTRIQLRSSDRSKETGKPLENKINGTGTPDYQYTFTANGPTALPGNTLFRIQGELFYIDKQP